MTATIPMPTDREVFADEPPTALPLLLSAAERAARDRRHKAIHESRAAVTLLLALRKIEEAQTLLEQFLDDGHGEDCRCAFCRSPIFQEAPESGPSGGYMANDARGLIWMLAASSVMKSSLVELSDDVLHRLADRYRIGQ